jgi:hypothetical protein
LLQRPYAERVIDFKIGELAVRAVGSHHELAVAPEHRRLDGEMLQLRICEIAENGGFIRLLHRELVMRARPCLVCALMALLACGGTDVICSYLGLGVAVVRCGGMGDGARGMRTR